MPRTTPTGLKGLLALQAGVVVRDRFPDQFHQVHRDLFAARHDTGGISPIRQS